MFEINTAGVNRKNTAGDFRQLIVGILRHNSSYQFVIVGFRPCKCGWSVLRGSFVEFQKGRTTILCNDVFQ